MNGTIRELLRTTFPWLGTDEDAGSGADVIESLVELYTKLKLKKIKINKTGKLTCPYCNKSSRFRYIEDIQNHREVSGMNEELNSLLVDGFYESTEGYDDGEDARLECRNCFAECSLPEKVEVTFV